MFIRVKTRNNTQKKAIQIVKSYRDGDKVRQKVVCTVGYAFDDDTLNRLKEVAVHLKAKLEYEEHPTLFPTEQLADMVIKSKRNLVESNQKLIVNLSKLIEKERIITGIHEIYGEVYKLLGFSTLLTKRHIAASKTLFHVTMARLANPLSKRATVSMLAKDFGADINLSKVYRMMDAIEDKIISKIQKRSFTSTNALLGGKVRIAFYDCTTLYFESFKPDELKQNGYSKDGKFNQPQVLLSLIVTEDGLPLGYEVFPGATFEGNTLENTINKLKNKYNLEDIIIIADSGLMSKKNIEEIEKQGLSYIIGARVKNMNKQKQKNILEGIYKVIESGSEERSYEMDNQGKRLIVKYSANAAYKDKKDREEAIVKLKDKLSKSKNPKSFLSNYGYKKYIRYEDEEMKVYLDESKLSEEEKWDGILGILTNVKDMSKEKIIENYKGLWQIESCFRVQKHDLKIRPIFHWTPRRVKSHIAICYLAFCCQQYLRYRLKLQEKQYSAEVIRQALTHIQLSILEDITTKKLYGVPSSMNEKAIVIYKIMRMKYSRTPYLV